jgi:predicted nuclease of predicted toxin-antitoxin system
MRFKVDENLPPEASTFLVEQGHDAVTVWGQQLKGATDPRLAEVCRSEQRVLVTCLDSGLDSSCCGWGHRPGSM